MNVDLILRNVNLVTLADAELGIKRNATIAFKDGLIAAINNSAVKATKEYDAKQQWLFPCFIDCHTHIVYGGNRANEFSLRLQGKTYAEIAKAGGGIKSTVRATRESSFSELLISAQNRLEMLFNEGVGVCEIKSGYGLNLETEIKMLAVAQELEKKLPIKIIKTFLGAHALPLEFVNADVYIDYLIEIVLPELVKQNLVDFVDGFCETIAFTPTQLEKLFQAANQYNLPIKLHAEQLTNFGGTQLAAKYRAVSVEHLEYASEVDIIAMAHANSVAVILPGAFYYLNEIKKPPIDLFRKYHLPIAIATDCNPGSSPVTSILLMLNMAAVLFNLTPTEALRGATINAAKALKLENFYGSLAVGKYANCCLWDIADPIDLVYHIGYKPKLTRIINGDIFHGK